MSETTCPFCGQIHGTACNAHQEAEAYTDLAADPDYQREANEWMNAPMGRPNPDVEAALCAVARYTRYDLLGKPSKPLAREAATLRTALSQAIADKERAERALGLACNRLAGLTVPPGGHWLSITTAQDWQAYFLAQAEGSDK